MVSVVIKEESMLSMKSFKILIKENIDRIEISNIIHLIQLYPADISKLITKPNTKPIITTLTTF